MDIPFISSGALSRAHYALVRKVEESTSEGAINRILEAEVGAIRLQLAQPSRLLKRSKEALIILLYCSMTATSSSVFPQGFFDFALPHALSLAEAGPNIEDKRIGYLFCAEMMPPEHEMRLMLVNTLRKDLEDGSISRMCLALDNIISNSSVDVIPAVQRRLYDLLSHNHPSVRRRTLFALRSLSQYEPGVLNQDIHSKILRRLQDPDGRVMGAALKLAETSSRMNMELAPATQDAINDVLESSIQLYSPTSRRSILAALRVVHGVGLRTLSLPAAFDLLNSCSSKRDTVVILGLYRLFKQFEAGTLRAVEEQTQTSLIAAIRDYLTSQAPNEVYVFLSCLESMDPDLWAGTSEVIPAVLEAWEVEQIMQLLDSRDNLIRKKTLHILSQVDQSILSAYYNRAISATTHMALPLRELNERTRRLLEIVEALSRDDGELYAVQVKDLLAHVEPHIAGKGILDSAIEGVLTQIRLRESGFRIPCTATLLTILCDADGEFGPTMTIILAALATEYSRVVALAPMQLLLGICHRLKGILPVAQEPCLLAMLRIAVDCEEIPAEVTMAVSEISQNAGRHIRHRCDQFLRLIDRKDVLVDIANNSKSFTLPDFLEALELENGNPKEAVGQAGTGFSQTSPVASRSVNQGTPSSKLRYDAYETPQAIPSLRTRHSQGSVSGSRSDRGSNNGRSPDLLVRELMAQTITPGNIVLVASSGDQGNNPKEGSELTVKTGLENPVGVPSLTVENQFPRVDLIAFDSPFVVDPPRSVDGGLRDAGGEFEFERAWESIENPQHSERGWCDASIDNVIRQLQGLDQHRLQVISVDMSPFIGDLKIVVTPEGGSEDGSQKAALLRLKESDEDSTLWRLRCSEDFLRGQVKQLLGSRHTNTSGPIHNSL